MCHNGYMSEFEEIIELSFTDREIATLKLKAFTFEEWKAMIESNGVEFED